MSNGIKEAVYIRSTSREWDITELKSEECEKMGLPIIQQDPMQTSANAGDKHYDFQIMLKTEFTVCF
jgi:hypothetical protein